MLCFLAGDCLAAALEFCLRAGSARGASGTRILASGFGICSLRLIIWRYINVLVKTADEAISWSWRSGFFTFSCTTPR